MKLSFWSIIFCSMFILSCSNPTPPPPVPEAPKADAPVKVGGDKDEHGCLGSAGYQWSSVKKDCIRSFELTLQLLNADKTFGAGVLFSDDKSQAEVFSKEGTFVLAKQSDTRYELKSADGGVFLRNANGKWEFGNLKDGAATYVEVKK